MNPEISVIICHHVGDLIYKCVDSVKESEKVKFEIIIITSNEELSLKGIPSCQVVLNKSMPATKRNIASCFAKGKYLAFLDDDVTIDSRCLYEQFSFLENNQRCGMTYSKLWNMEFTNRLDEAGGYLTWTGFIWSRAQQNLVDEGQFDTPCKIFAGKSASCMIKHNLFSSLGGFDDSFGILGEESDLSWRVWLSEKEVWFIPSSTGYHAFNTKYKPFDKHYTHERVYFNGCRNYLTMLLKNIDSRYLWIIPLHAGIWFGVGCVMFITGKAKEGLSILKGLKYFLFHLKDTLTKRSVIQDSRVAKKELWNTISRNSSFKYYFERFHRYVRSGLHG